MQDTERQKFEENWKSAFDDAEMTPPDRVWNSLELNLAGEESAVMKKRVVFYQRLAAATVLFALLSGLYAFYPRDDSKQHLASNKVKVEEVKPAGEEQRVANDEQDNVTEQSDKSQDASRQIQDQSTTSEVPSSKSQDASNSQVASRESRANQVTNNAQRATGNTQTTTRNPQPETSDTQLAIVDSPITTEPAVVVTDNAQLPVTDIVITEAPVVAQESFATGTDKKEEVKEEEKKEVAVLVSPLLQNNAPEEIIERKAKKKSAESFWVALGGSAGNYTPNTTSTSTFTPTQSFASASSNFADGPVKSAALAAPAPPKPEPKIGTAYSVGLAVGKKFGRFVLQTGVNVGKQQIDYESNYDSKTSANSSKAAVSDYMMYSPQQNSNTLAYTSEYTVNSTMEIVSIPVQAGYMIIDRKFGWQVNAGMSTDFFVRNVLIDESGRRERFTQAAGSESPYRSVNWSGLANTEISYRLGQHYRVSVVPGVRYSFNSILKEPTDGGRPVILDLGFRFKYLFE